MKKITVIDGHGGKLGGQLIKAIAEKFPDLPLFAVGTNSAATAAMLKCGAKTGATGENAVIVACKKSDVIIGPIGIVIADALFGEITPPMAVAVGQADAVRILLPVNKCDNFVAGIGDLSTSQLLSDAIKKLTQILDETSSVS